MLTDRYDLFLSTTSAAARDAYVEASGLALTFYPGRSREAGHVGFFDLVFAGRNRRTSRMFWNVGAMPPQSALYKHLVASTAAIPMFTYGRSPPLDRSALIEARNRAAADDASSLAPSFPSNASFRARNQS